MDLRGGNRSFGPMILCGLKLTKEYVQAQEPPQTMQGAKHQTCGQAHPRGDTDWWAYSGSEMSPPYHADG